MLILSRRLGESIVIGEDISVTILGVTGGQIRIGIEAPKHVAVHREEIFHKINNNNEARSRQQENVRRRKQPQPSIALNGQARVVE